MRGYEDDPQTIGLRDMIEYIMAKMGKKDLKMAEIGSWTGESAYIFASYPQITLVFAVDPFEYQDIMNDDECKQGFEKGWYENLEERFDEKVRKYQHKIKKIKLISKDAVSKVEDNFLDFVYIDAGHQYEDVFHDCTEWSKKVHNGGYVCGHDYYGRPDVRQAITDSLGRIPDEVFMDSSWIMLKRNDG